MSRRDRIKKLELEHAVRNPPKYVPPLRVLQDGARVERLDGSTEPIPPGARLIVRNIVDPGAPTIDDAEDGLASC